VLYGQRRALVLFYLLGCLRAAAALVVLWALAVARLATGGLGWWGAKQPRAFPVGPVCLVWFLVVLLFFSAAATKWRHSCAGACRAAADQPVLESPCVGRPPRGHWPYWPQPWMVSASMPWCFAVWRLPLPLHHAGTATVRPTRISPRLWRAHGPATVLALVLAVAAVWVSFSLLWFKKGRRAVSGPDRWASAVPAAAVVAGLAPLKQPSAKQNRSKDLAVPGWTGVRAQRRLLVESAYMRLLQRVVLTS